MDVRDDTRRSPRADEGNIAGNQPNGLSRRRFLGRAGSVAAAGAAAGMLGALDAATTGSPAQAGAYPGLAARARANRAFSLRVAAAQRQHSRPLLDHPTNGDEDLYPNRIGSFCKCLPHNARGEVEPAAYSTYLAAILGGNPIDLEAIPLAGTSRLWDPQAAYTFELEGPDSHQTYVDPAPAFASAQIAAEMAEDYWMALARDVPFAAFDTHPLIQQASADLSGFSDFQGPKVGGAVTPATLFRGPTLGDLTGPYLSQFLWLPIPYGAMSVVQRYPVAPRKDFLTTYELWLANQQGLVAPSPASTAASHTPTRYLSTGRDVTTFVHSDFTYQTYLNAALILLKLGAPLKNSPYATSKTQMGFVTFGVPHVLDYLTRVTNASLKAAWFQKWLVHRRLRPEAFAGHVHTHLTGAASYPIHSDLLEGSTVLEMVRRRFGSYLLPQAYPEGAPAHPSYPAAHAVIAGACVTVLKAFFDESYILPAPVVASADGQRLHPYTYAPLTVGNELNKLASNIALGRDMAGVHWRSDGANGLLLGEAVATGILQDRAGIYSEPFQGFTFTRFDGTVMTI